MPDGSPFDLGGRVFFWWTGSKIEGFTDNYWTVNFRVGVVDDVQLGYSLSVLCVRGGPKVDAY